MILSALKNVFNNARYSLIAVLVSTAIFAFAVWLPNWRLIATIITSETATFTEKISIPFSLFGSISTNFTIVSASYTILIAILFGINSAMIIYLFSRKVAAIKQNGLATSIGGVVSGMLGVGCATCGSVILTSILPLIGVGGVLAIFPFGGQEFGVFGVGMLGFSIFLIAKKIQDPLVCDVNKE